MKRFYFLLAALFFLETCGLKRVAGIYCEKSADCPIDFPICDTQWNSCFACSKGSDCTSGICNSNGSCLPETEITYVDNKNGACTTGGGTKAQPFCDLQSAITSGSKETIFVAESSSSYGKLKVTSGKWTIYGPETGVAKLTGDLMNPAVNITGTGVEISFSGFEISGGGAGQDGIFCSNSELGPTLRISRSTIKGVPGAGISSTKCTVIIDRTTIGPSNSGGGVSLNNSKYSITNSFIVDNLSNSSPGISFSNATSAIGTSAFAHNTIVNNSFGTSKAGAIACNASDSIKIENSIILDNSKSSGATPSQVSGNCTFQNTLIGDATTPAGSGNRNTPTPDFKSVTDYHMSGMTTNNLACCIDQIDSSPVDHDFDGTKRPQGAKWDIGAHELVR